MGKHVAVIGIVASDTIWSLFPGAGPVGIEMALVLIKNGYSVTLIEQGESCAANMHTWKHVSLFSPNSMNMSRTGREVLQELGATIPEEDEFYVAEKFLASYLIPLVKYLEGSSKCTVMLSTTVVSVTRAGLSKAQHAASSSQRRHTPFLLLLQSTVESTLTCDIVIDASGTYGNPNYMGPSGIPAIGERMLRLENKIHYSIPSPGTCGTSDVTSAVIGCGASAITTINLLLHSNHKVVWITRTPLGTAPYRRIEDDPLPQRDALYALGNELAAGSNINVTYISDVDVTHIQPVNSSNAPHYQLTLRSRTSGDNETVVVQAIYANVGYHPNTAMTDQLQVHYCYATDGPMKLSAALMASTNSSANCLTQVSQGKDTMRNPEPDFYIIGMKSYGRASSFLMRLGYQQVQDVMQLIKENEVE